MVLYMYHLLSSLRLTELNRPIFEDDYMKMCTLPIAAYYRDLIFVLTEYSIHFVPFMLKQQEKRGSFQSAWMD